MVENKYDISKGLLISDLTYTGNDGIQRRWQNESCIYSSNEWICMLTSAGFQRLQIFADLGMSEIEPDSKIIVISARKGTTALNEGVGS